MGASRGSQAVEKWRKSLSREVVRVTLVAELVGTDGEEVGEWFAATTREEGDEPDCDVLGFRDPRWTAAVFDLAQNDTIGRGQGTRYSVRSYYESESRSRTRTHLQMVMPRDPSEKEDARDPLDGSTASIIQQLQRGTAEANKAMFDMVKMMQQASTTTNALVAQLSAALREKEETIAKLVDLRVSDKIELATKLEQVAESGGSKSGSIIDNEFKNLLEQAMPHLAKALVNTGVEKIGPVLEFIVAMGSDTAAKVSTPAPAAAIAATVVNGAADVKNVQ